jgi:predicted HAD superfamily hydrolase
MRPTDLAKSIAAYPHKCVAFDVFDTLVARTVAPEHVKLLAADMLSQTIGWRSIDGQIIYQHRQAAEHDLALRSWTSHQEFELHFDQIANELYNRLVSGSSLPETGQIRFRDRMLESELAAERLVLRPVEPVIKALSLARQLGKQIVLISDFHLGAQHLRQLLKPFNFLQPTDSLFVSSDYMASKRSGRLYQLVCTELGISSAELLMIGDNPYSDHSQARANGIQSIHTSEPERISFYKSPSASVVHSPSRNAAFRDVLRHCSLSESRNLRAVVPSLFLFTERLYAMARRQELRELCFLAREGRALQTMFEIYQDSLACDRSERIRTHYLLVSRRSTYAASLRSLAEEKFDGLFRIYAHLSLRDFLRSIGFEDKYVEVIAAETQTNPDHAVDDFRASALLERLRSSDLFRELYDRHRLIQRDNLTAYIRQCVISANERPLTVVDIGWKGSIQDHLRAALPNDIRLQGYYFGLINIGQPTEYKHGLIFTNIPQLSRHYRTYSENRTLFEVLLCAEHGSALRYEKGDDGKIQVFLDSDDDELDYIRNELLPLRDDILLAFREFCQVRRRFCVSDRELEEFAARAHAEFVFRPWLPNGRLLSQAQHRENFGLFMTSRYAPKTPLDLHEKWRFFLQLAHDRSNLFRSFWPAFTLYQHTNKIATAMYGLWRRLQDHRKATWS